MSIATEPVGSAAHPRDWELCFLMALKGEEAQGKHHIRRLNAQKRKALRVGAYRLFEWVRTIEEELRP